MAEQTKLTQQIKDIPELVQVDVPEVLPFNEIISTLTLTSSSLEKMISEFFGGIFNDFEGSKIMDGQAGLKCKLYFKPCMNKGDGVYAVKVRGEDIVNQKQNRYSLTELVNNVNMMSKSKRYDLEDIAKEILAEFILIGPRDSKIVKRIDPKTNKEVGVRLPNNWNLFTEEISDKLGTTNYVNPYLAVTIDLLPIIGKFYGRKDPIEVEEFAAKGMIPKDRYQYAVNIVKILNATTRSYVLEIRKIDIKEMDALSRSIGYGNVSGTIVMTRR